MVPERIFEEIEAGAAVLTANNRVARLLSQAYGVRQRDAGRVAWPAPQIFSWHAWLHRWWEDRFYSGQAEGLLLNASQEQSIWEQVVGSSRQGANLLRSADTAARAREAWALVRQWRLPLDSPAWKAHEDSAAFLRWAGDVQNRLRFRGWVDAASLPDLLAGRVPVPARVLLIGFDELTPQQRQFLESLQAAGSAVECVKTAAPERREVRCAAYPDADCELEAAARWARALVERDPRSRIGIVVPELDALRARADRIFADVLHPGSLLPGASRGRRYYNISLGVPLDQWPLVSAAFLLIESGGETTPSERASRLLRSPFFSGGISQATTRARLDADLARSQRLEVKTSALPLRLSRWTEAAQKPTAWARAFAEALADAGWPGERPLDSAEFQTLEAWRELLGEFASLDLTVPEISAAEAIRRLRRLAGETIFQPEQDVVPVQILGALEAAGLRFDRLWVAGMHDEAWPAQPRPNPFLPAALRRDLPRASAARELDFAKIVTQRLLVSAPDVVVTWPRHTEDRDLHPSALILPLPEVAEDAIEGAGPRPLSRFWQESAAMESLRDERAPPLADGAASGGTRLFKLQAACPFQAFAAIRLGAKSADTPQPGVTPLDHGIIAHAALAAFWSQVRTHAGLCALPAGSLRELVESHTAAAVSESTRDLPPRYAELERERVTALLLAWLEIERSRDPFTVVTPEEKRTAAVGGLQLRIRPDRIDRLADGREVVIDYKTGDCSPNSWSGDRPDEPQVPLYCITRDTVPAAALFARLKAGKIGFAGVAETGQLLPGVKATDMPMPEQVARWRMVLDRLAGEFRSGSAAIAPIKGNLTCNLCGLTALCRIHEREAAW